MSTHPTREGKSGQQVSGEDAAEVRCIVAGCREPAAGVLTYRPRGPLPNVDQPLCVEHSDPKFHLRPLSTFLKPTWWKWVPLSEFGRDAGAPNGSTHADSEQ